MRKFINYKIIGLALVVALFAGCDTATQDASPVVSPDGYPVATFSTDLVGNTVHEGDTVVYTITFDKTIDRSVTFNINQTGGAAVDHVDYIVEPGVLKPYTLETELLIIFLIDNIPEPDELIFQGVIEVPSLADKYLVNPSVTYPTIDLNLVSVNDPTLLTIMLSWETGDDLDIVTWSNTVDYPMTEWGDGGATGENPEFDKSIWLADPLGTYYVSMMHWGAAPFDYKFTLGHPDGSIQIIEGSFDSDNLNKYIMDWWTVWGGDPGYESYRLLTVENDGTKFVVTPIAPL